MKEFLIQSKQYGLRVAINNTLINFTKWFIGAKRIEISYCDSKYENKILPAKIIVKGMAMFKQTKNGLEWAYKAPSPDQIINLVSDLIDLIKKK